jgi:hypothetical protein
MPSTPARIDATTTAEKRSNETATVTRHCMQW